MGSGDDSANPSIPVSTPVSVLVEDPSDYRVMRGVVPVFRAQCCPAGFTSMEIATCDSPQAGLQKIWPMDAGCQQEVSCIAAFSAPNRPA